MYLSPLRITAESPWILVITVLGVALRIYHYARNPAMWHDEAALVINVLGKDFSELLGPLYFQEAAPPLFLWVEKLVALSLGDSLLALRLIPLLASCLSVVLMARVVSRVLARSSASWALLLFACSDRLLWHSCEAKPYALDVFAAVFLTQIFLSTRCWSMSARLALFCAMTPVLTFLVYPGCFLCGGLVLAIFPSVYRSKRQASWIGFAILNFIVLASFTWLWLGPIHAQRGEMMDQCWVKYFPNWHRVGILMCTPLT